MRRPGRLASVAAAVLLLVVGVALYRAAALPSRQVGVPPAPMPAIDVQAAAQRLGGALRIPTISTQRGGPEPAAIARFHQYLERSFPRVHRALSRELIGGSALYAWYGRDAAVPPILLLGHLDVVPVEAGTEAAWTHPPFSGAIDGGYIWGRGALDMKLTVVGLLEAIDALLADGFMPHRTVLMAFGHDEEVGGAAGAAAIAAVLEARGVRPSFVFDEGLAILDGFVPGVSAPVAAVGIAEKGYVSVELAADAVGGHASMPPRRSAAGILAAALTALEDRRMPRHLDGPAAQMLEALAPDMPWGPRVAVANLWLFRPLALWALDRTPPTAAMLRTTVAPTMLEGSSKENVLPARARAVLNIRVHPADRIDEVLERLAETIDDPRVRISVLPGTLSEPSALTPIDDAEFAAVQRTIAESFPGVLVAPGLVLGATDSRHYRRLTTRIYRFLPVALRPDDTVRLHGTNERVGIEEYARAVAFYGRLIRNAAGR